MLGSRSAYTRARILEAAEGLFAEKGYESTSLREITAKARVNLSSVHYHFGSKEGLIEAVHQQIITTVNRERVEILDELERELEGEPLHAEDIVEAYFRPLIRHALKDTLIGKLVFNAGSHSDDKSLSINVLLKPDASTYDRFRIALESALPALPQIEILWRFRFMLMTACCAFAQMDGLLLASKAHASASLKLNEATQRVLRFLVAGLLAPVPPSNKRVASVTSSSVG